VIARYWLVLALMALCVLTLRPAPGSPAAGAVAHLSDPHSASGLSHVATDAFLTAGRAAMWTAAGLGVVGTAATFIWLPGRARRPETRETAEVVSGPAVSA
jgi:hypothetical protein